MKKRLTLKGKGADIFLREDPRQPKTKAATTKEKATFYLPPPLLASLDDAWFTLRKNNRKIRKSDIVRSALEEFLRNLEKSNKKRHNG
ncbi:hypothetical protein ES702_04258 [subsurface metagenome]